MRTPLDAHEVAKRMLRDPRFGYQVEARIADAMTPRPYKNRLAELAASTFEIEEIDGQVSIWIAPLKTYSIGQNCIEARHDVVEEIMYAPDVLWEARNA